MKISIFNRKWSRSYGVYLHDNGRLIINFYKYHIVLLNEVAICTLICGQLWITTV